MDLRVLGCSGGVGVGLRTTSLLIDRDVLIDAGSGVGELSLAEMAQLRHVFLTHSHLDHIAFLPLLLDSIFDQIHTPLAVHGQAETLEALRTHVFNGIVWPDFSRLPHPDRPVLEYVIMRPGESCHLQGRSLEMIEVKHTVPGVGYRVECGGGVIAFSGDTTVNDTFWAALNAHDRLDILILEAAFPNSHATLAQMSRHYCPNMLGEELRKLKHDPAIYITHNKPGDEALIFQECVEALGSGRKLARLQPGMVFTL